MNTTISNKTNLVLFVKDGNSNQFLDDIHQGWEYNIFRFLDINNANSKIVKVNCIRRDKSQSNNNWNCKIASYFNDKKYNKFSEFNSIFFPIFVVVTLWYLKLQKSN